MEGCFPIDSSASFASLTTVGMTWRQNEGQIGVPGVYRRSGIPRAACHIRRTWIGLSGKRLFKTLFHIFVGNDLPALDVRQPLVKGAEEAYPLLDVSPAC